MPTQNQGIESAIRDFNEDDFHGVQLGVNREDQEEEEDEGEEDNGDERGDGAYVLEMWRHAKSRMIILPSFYRQSNLKHHSQTQILAMH